MSNESDFPVCEECGFEEPHLARCIECGVISPCSCTDQCHYLVRCPECADAWNVSHGVYQIPATSTGAH